MIYHTIAQVVNAVAHVVGEEELGKVSRLGAYWTSCFWRARHKHPVFFWAYHEIRALDLWRLQGRRAADEYLHAHGIYD